MNNSTIISLSQNKAIDSGGNAGEWTNNFNESFVLNTGDSIAMKMAIINSRNNDDGIVLNEDVIINMEFGYYVSNVSQPYRSLIGQNNNGFDGKDYVAYWCDNPSKNLTSYSKPITESIQFTLPAGSYSYSGIAEFISKQCAQAQVDTFNVLNRDNYNKENSFSRWLLTSGNKFLKNTYDTLDGQPDSLPMFFDIDTFDNLNPTSLNANLVSSFYFNGANNYMYGATQVALVYNDQNNGMFEWQYIHTPLYDASDNKIVRFGLDYVKNQNIQKYTIQSRDYWLMPYDTVQQPLLQPFTQTKYSGIYFTKLEPASFWESLGFDLDNICVQMQSQPMRIGGNTYNINVPKAKYGWNSVTTGGLITLDNIKQNPSLQSQGTTFEFAYFANVGDFWEVTDPSVPLNVQTFQTDFSVPLMASKQPEMISDSGYYLLEIVGSCFNNDVYLDSGRNAFISAIASKYHINSNFITVFDDGAILYTNNGEPVLFNTFKVRVLDPITLELADIGNLNTVFLQIFRNGQQIQQEKNKKKEMEER